MYNPTLYVPNFPLAFFVSCVLVRDALLPLLHFITGDFFLLNYCPCKTHCRTTGRACGFLLVLKWLGRFNSLAVPLMIIDCAVIGLSIIGIVILQIKKHEVSFCSLYGVAGFFIVMQTACLFI